MDYRIPLTYDDVLRIANELVAHNPEKVAVPYYFSINAKTGFQETNCIVDAIMRTAGFNAPTEWWNAQRYDGTVFTDGKDRVRFNTHIRFLIHEMTTNEDVYRDAFLRTLQTHQDRGMTWEHALKRAIAYTDRCRKNDTPTEQDLS